MSDVDHNGPRDPISERLDRTANAINQLRTGERVFDAEVLFAIATSNEIAARTLSAVLEIKDDIIATNAGVEDRHRAVLDRLKTLTGEMRSSV
jgi:hypothetical protein